MQVKTFIYGTPFGFNFYEDDSQYKDYFKSFYISSRVGRRLMVNRLDNGETTYNFLCYNIAEFGQRPNAFFGMSLVLSNYQYCANFGKLYDWFNFLFEKLITGHNIISQSGNGLQYKVKVFSENSGDVEWLKANIPNILSSPDVKIERYDSYFSDRKTGKIAQFNTTEKPENILKSFRQNRWISLSPTFVAERDYPELDWFELSTSLDDVTKQLLPIAINPEKEHLPILQKINSEMKENYKNISEYVEKATDEDYKGKFVELQSKYYEILATQLPQIARKITSEPKPQPQTRVCTKCGREKPLSAFNGDDNVCNACHEEEAFTPEQQRLCSKCGKQKPFNEFGNGESVCNECHNHAPMPIPFPTKYLYGGVAALALIAIIVCVIIFIPHKPEPQSDNTDTNSGNRTEQQAKTTENKVNESEYSQFIKDQDFKSAYQSISDKTDFDTYKARLKTDFEKYLLTLSLTDIQTQLIVCDDVCRNIDLEKSVWNDFIKDGNTIENSYLKKNSITDQERTACIEKIKPYKNNDLFASRAKEWESNLNNIPSPNRDKNITYCTKNGQLKSLTKTTGIEIYKGDYVDITCSNEPKCINGEKNKVTIGKHPEGKPPFYRIVFPNVGTFIFDLDNVQLTVKVKVKLQKH